MFLTGCEDVGNEQASVNNNYPVELHNQNLDEIFSVLDGYYNGMNDEYIGIEDDEGIFIEGKHKGDFRKGIIQTPYHIGEDQIQFNVFYNTLEIPLNVAYIVDYSLLDENTLIIQKDYQSTKYTYVGDSLEKAYKAYSKHKGSDR